MSTPDCRAGWKNYDDFAAGIATNRLPRSNGLIGRALHLRWEDEEFHLTPLTIDRAQWRFEGARADSGLAACEVIEVAPQTFFVDLSPASCPSESLTLVLNMATSRVLAVRSRIRDADQVPGEPRVAQSFLPGTLVGPQEACGETPAETRDLLGLRTFQTYSPHHTYEHTYLNSRRYAWQCLVGVQRGHGDVDLASYWRFADGLYVFTFREFRIPVASVFVFNFHDMRSTGKFLGLTSGGAISNSPAGAFITKASLTTYPAYAKPA